MELRGPERSKIARRVFPDHGAKFLRQPGRFESRERQVRRKGPLFTRDAKFFRAVVDIGRQSFQIRRRLDARPENARMFIVGKKTESAKIECNGLIGARGSESVPNGRELWFPRFTNEFDRHVKIVR